MQALILFLGVLCRDVLPSIVDGASHRSIRSLLRNTKKKNEIKRG